MTTPLRNDAQGMSRREEMTVSTAAMTDVPWAVAGAAGVVVTGADLAFHLLGGHLALTTSLAAGTVAAFTVAGGSVVIRRNASRAARWARSHPWRFAVLPGDRDRGCRFRARRHRAERPVRRGLHRAVARCDHVRPDRCRRHRHAQQSFREARHELLASHQSPRAGPGPPGPARRGFHPV